MTRSVFILALGTADLEVQIKKAAELNPALDQLYGCPKCLLLIDDRPALSYLWDYLRAAGGSVDDCHIVTDALTFKAVERWSMHSGFDLAKILNVGCVDMEKDGATLVEALDLIQGLRAVRAKGERVMVMTADVLLDADLAAVLFPAPASAKTKPDESAIFVGASAVGSCFRVGSAGFVEEVKAGGTPLPVAMDLSANCWDALGGFVGTRGLLMEANVPSVADSMGTGEYCRLLEHLSKSAPLKLVVVPDKVVTWKWASEAIGLGVYFETWRTFKPTPAPSSIAALTASKNGLSKASMTPIYSRAYARVGLMGNPSDGFYGRTLSLLVSNFWADVTLIPNASESDGSVSFRANPLNDPLVFASEAVAAGVCAKDGYYGACRLFLATLKAQVSIFSGLKNIRQVGLAGSSALITALLKALIKFHELDADPALLPPYVRANLALSAERDELGIAAGQQDRVIQAYGGLVYMDFNESLMRTRGYGEYEPMDVALPSDSGTIHNNVRVRFAQGEEE
ncbi:hypothetical protein HK101_001927, partial [Irineochytrium annulatum]